MTAGKQQSRDTIGAMRDTADALEDAEDVLHRSAEDSPDPDRTARLHRLGDAVTNQARNIARRAEDLSTRREA